MAAVGETPMAGGANIAVAPVAPSATGRPVHREYAAADPRAQRQRLVGLAMALPGAVILIVGPFLDWLEAPDGSTITGWDLFTIQSSAGENVWVIPAMFGASGTAFFTGLTILVAGGVALLVAVVAMVTPRTSGSREYTVAPVAAVTLIVFSIGAGLCGLWNGVMGMMGAPDEGGAVRIGLYLLPVAFPAVFIGVTAMVQRRLGWFGRKLLGQQ
jgi:hypothetical protein